MRLDSRQQVFHQLDRRQSLRGDQSAGLGDREERRDGPSSPALAGLRRRRLAARRLGAALALTAGFARLHSGAFARLPLARLAGRLAARCDRPGAEAGGPAGTRSAISSANGRSRGMLAISPATCRQASTRSATWPGLSASPARDSRSCISPGLSGGTERPAKRTCVLHPSKRPGNPSQPCPQRQAASPCFLRRSDQFAAPDARSNTCRCRGAGGPSAARPAELAPPA